MRINADFEAIVHDVLIEIDMKNSAYCENEKAELKGNDRAIDLTWDRYERHDDKLNAIEQLLRYGLGIMTTYKTNGYGYIIGVTFTGSDFEETFEIQLQGWIERHIESEKKRIQNKYFGGDFE